MAVYLPTGAIGNGQFLATIGKAGEIMTYFYPRTDFAQNVRECMPCIYIGDPGNGYFHWTWEPVFSSRQWYTPRTNILNTELILESPPLRINIEDFSPPGESALVRVITVHNQDHSPLIGTLMHYYNFNLREIPGKQAVRYNYEGGYVLQYLRDAAICVGGTVPDIWRCGKAWADDPHSAKSDLYDGHLNGQSEDIGEVDFALGWRLHVPPGQNKRIEMLICAGPGCEHKAEALPRLQKVGVEALRADAIDSADDFLKRSRKLELPEKLQSAYERSLLALLLLGDVNTGSFSAAPEFDPQYERCGGYGYCWPRDATESALALKAAGYPEYLDRLVDWYLTTQLSDGSWAQRYWSDGQIAASWALREGFHQIDQSAAALLGVSIYCQEHPERIHDFWPCILRAMDNLNRNVTPNGWHQQACDLWETYCGVFVYTNASVFAALHEAGKVAELYGHVSESGEWAKMAEQMRQATLASFNGTYFPRGFTDTGEVDAVVDSSSLGLVYPCGLLDLSDPEQRAMMESNVTVIEERLGAEQDGQRAIRRFEGETYLGGVIGCVNTLWLAQVLLGLARIHRPTDQVRAEELRRRALAYINFCLDHSTPTGLLPELIGTRSDTPYWAAPHGWASGLLVRCMLLL